MRRVAEQKTSARRIGNEQPGRGGGARATASDFRTVRSCSRPWGIVDDQGRRGWCRQRGSGSSSLDTSRQKKRLGGGICFDSESIKRSSLPLRPAPTPCWSIQPSRRQGIDMENA